MESTILLVDDKPANLLVYEEIISSIDVECLSVTSGNEAIKELSQNKISLILLDVQMPGMGGYETLKAIKEHGFWDEIPVILVSAANISQKEQAKGIKLGAIDFLTKPIDPDLLISKIVIYLELFEFRTMQNAKIDEITKEITTRTKELELKNKQLRKERKQTNAAINIINSSPSIAFRWRNIQGLPLEYVSDNAKKISGYSTKELVGNKMSILNLVYKDDAERVQKEIEEFAKNKNEESFVHKPYRIVSKSGKHIWVRNQVKIIRNVDGKITHFQGILTDITEKKNTEDEVHKLTTAIQQIGSSIIITDLIGNIQYTNPYFTKITGYTAVEVRGKNPNILKSGDTCEMAYKTLWKTISSGKVWEGTFHNVKKNGEKYWESAIITPVFNERNEITNYIGLKQDITKSVETTNKLAESEKRYRSLIEDNHSVMMILSRKGKILNVNKACAKYYGYSIEHMQNMNIKEINFHSRKTIDKNISDAFKHKRNYFEFKHRLADGSVRDVEVYSGSINYNDEPALLSIIHDVTEKAKTARELVVAKEKAIESDRLKTAFLANMSHEIRTPMNAILGFSQLLTMPGLKKSELVDYVATITNSGKQLLNLIDDIISISQIEAGIIDILLKKASPDNILKNVSKIFSLTAQKTNIDFSYENKLPENFKEIFTDPRRIQQILINLLSNSFKFTKSGYVKFGARLVNNNIEFYVKDTGIGISRKDQEMIFDRFMQVDHGPDVIYGGTGIGLSISKAIVNKLGGEINVNSKKNHGSEFYFSIPIKVDGGKTVKPKIDNRQRVDFKGKVFLIAEDDSTNFELLDIMIRKHNGITIWAKSGDDAISIYKSNNDIKMIFMDIKMPKKDGFATTEEIRKFDKSIPIIAQTAYAQSDDKQKIISAGCTDYISKPVMKDKLFELIEKYL